MKTASAWAVRAESSELASEGRKLREPMPSARTLWHRSYETTLGARGPPRVIEHPSPLAAAAFCRVAPLCGQQDTPIRRLARGGHGRDCVCDGVSRGLWGPGCSAPPGWFGQVGGTRITGGCKLSS